MRVLITGAAGQLGHDLVATCSAAADDVVAVDRRALDITDRDAVTTLVTAVRPDALINAAAYTAVDRAESDEIAAYAVNAAAVHWLAQATAEVGAHFVHVSTDYVFDGTLDRPYREDDTTNPQTVYGKSKLAGEQLVGAAGAIVRTSWVCGEHGSNMVGLVLQMVGEGRDMAFVDDQRGCPTFTTDLAVAVRRVAVDRRVGVHHITNQGAVSWFEFVREILAAAGHDPGLVRPIATTDLDPPRAAQRPANSVLENAVWQAAGLPLLRDFRAPLTELIARLS